MWTPDGQRCTVASESCASDHFRLFGEREEKDLPLNLSPHNLFPWLTRLRVLSWDIDTVHMTISVPREKLTRLRTTPQGWPQSRQFSSESDLRKLIGKLLHLCEVVRPGKYFERRMLNQSGLPPVRPPNTDAHQFRTKKT